MVIGKAVVFGQVADALADARRAHRLVQQLGLAVGGAGDAEQDLHQGGLAGAVLPEQAVDFALVDLQADALEGLDLAVMLDDIARLDDRHSGSPEPRDMGDERSSELFAGRRPLLR